MDKMHANAIFVALFMVLALLEHCMADFVTITFKNGVSLYTGAKATAISTYQGPIAPKGQYNENGVTFADGENHWCLGNAIPSNPAYDQRYLIKFLGLKAQALSLNIPAEATVVNATLTVVAHGDDSRGDAFIRVKYPNKNWDETTPTTMQGGNGEVGWRYFRKSTGEEWEGQGASGASDTVTGKEHRIPTTGTIEKTYLAKSYTGSISAVTVNDWFKNSDASNWGLLLINGVDNFHVGIAAPQYKVLADRPVLTVTFETSGTYQPPPDDPPTGNGEPTASPTIAKSAATMVGTRSLAAAVVLATTAWLMN